MLGFLYQSVASSIATSVAIVCVRSVNTANTHNYHVAPLMAHPGPKAIVKRPALPTSMWFIALFLLGTSPTVSPPTQNGTAKVQSVLQVIMKLQI